MRRSGSAPPPDPRPPEARGQISIPVDAFLPTKRRSDGSMGRAVDLFAGAGGFGLGLSLAGWTVTGAVERDAWACETLQTNHPECEVVVGDITALTDRALGAIVERADLIVGGPPCQGFSVANNAAGDPTDPRNSLFREFVRAVSLARPGAFVMENVPGLLRRHTASGRPVIEIVRESFEALGYHTACAVLEGRDFGVPQLRPRLFVVGSRRPLRRPFPKPTHGEVRDADTIALFRDPASSYGHTWLIDAIGDLPPAGEPGASGVVPHDREAQCPLQALLRGGATGVTNHHAMRHSKRLIARFASIGWGESGADAPSEHRARRRGDASALSGKDYDQNNRRLHPFRVSHTIPASFYANFVHPFADRNFTPREGARIQTFPDWYTFCGKPTVVSHKLLRREGRDAELHLCQYNQIGNAVPPMLSFVLGRHLREEMQRAEVEAVAAAV